MKMNTFNAYIKKEMLESIRQYRYLILAAGILMFSILDPIMLHFLPEMLKGQMPFDVGAFKVTQVMGLQGYLKDLIEIGNLFVIFTLAASLSDEIYSEKLVFPYSKGGSPTAIVLAKFLHYSVYITGITLIGIGINFYYVNLLFPGGSISFGSEMLAGTLVSMFFVSEIAIAMFLSSILKKGIVAGFVTMLLSYGSIVFMQFNTISTFLPYKLVDLANKFTLEGILKPIIITSIYIIIFIVATSIKMEKVEVI